MVQPAINRRRYGPLSTIDKLKEQLAEKIRKRDKLNAEIRKLQNELQKKESQEIMNTIQELEMTPGQALELLKKAKSSIKREAEKSDQASDE